MKSTQGLFLLLLIAGTAMAATLEEQAVKLERQLVAPCCWRQSVADHLSPEADRIRGEIRALLQQGRSQEEILGFYVAQYGQAILAELPNQGFNRLAYLLPGCFLLVLGGGLGWLAVRSRRQPAAAPISQPPPPSTYAARLEQELKQLEE